MIWFTTNASVRPPSNAAGDATTYVPAYVDGSHLMLDRPYAGTTGTHGWALDNSYSVVGYGDLPYMVGLLSFGFDMASRAIADTDAAGAALYRSYNVDAANWVKTYGYRSSVKGLYYFAQSVNCQAPIAENNAACVRSSSTQDSRVLGFETLRGIAAAYSYNHDAGLRTFADLLYNAMWAKPTTCPSGSTLCIADGSSVNAYDDGGWYMNGTPPTGQGPKWFGQAFGVSALSSWPAYRAGGPQAQNGPRLYVGFDPGAVRGTVALRVTSTAPSGAISQIECSASPCVLDVNGTAGDQIVKLEYLSASGGVLAVSESPVIGGH